jgi:F420 biosynthesis protein FbiB-like protein
MSSVSELHSFLRARVSVRRFTPEQVEGKALEQMLVTATSAPSAHNRQPWRFAVVTKDSSKLALADAMAERFRADLQADGVPSQQVEARVEKSRARIIAAPIVVVLCMDATEMDQYPDAWRNDAERTMAIQSTANAGLLLLLAAHAEGLAGVWICAPVFAPAAVRAALTIPAEWEPQAMLLIGHPAETPARRGRKSLSEVLIRV